MMEAAKSVRSESVVGLVLCGGQSSRMGRDKSAMEIRDGVSFLKHAVDRLDSIFDEVWISGHQSMHRHEGYRVIHDDPSLGGGGPMRGLICSLMVAKQIGRIGLLVCPVDAPQLQVKDLRQILNSIGSGNQVTVATSDRLEPLIGYYPISVIDSMLDSMGAGRRSVQRWLENCPHQTVPLSVIACQNINTPEDFDKLK